jgi:hypothetical protein
MKEAFSLALSRASLGEGGSCAEGRGSYGGGSWELDEIGYKVRFKNWFPSIIFEPSTTANNQLEGLLSAEVLALVGVDEEGETTEGTSAIGGVNALTRKKLS